jgi:hypothetical protein
VQESLEGKGPKPFETFIENSAPYHKLINLKQCRFQLHMG